MRRENQQALITKDRMRVDVLVEFYVRVKPTAEAIADAGIRRGIVALLANPSEPRRESGGSLYELPFAGGSMRIRMTSEEGKIDLNAAPDELIQGLLRALFESGEIISAARAAHIADAILDWRDEDQWVRTYGAEDRTYAANGISLGARDGPFLSVAELNLVLGVDAESFAHLAPWVTVHSRSSRVDPVTAPRTVVSSSTRSCISMLPSVSRSMATRRRPTRN